LLTGVKSVAIGPSCAATLASDGSVAVWSINPEMSGAAISKTVPEEAQTGVKAIFADNIRPDIISYNENSLSSKFDNYFGFIALKSNGSVINWHYNIAAPEPNITTATMYVSGVRSIFQNSTGSDPYGDITSPSPRLPPTGVLLSDGSYKTGVYYDSYYNSPHGIVLVAGNQSYTETNLFLRTDGSVGTTSVYDIINYTP